MSLEKYGTSVYASINDLPNIVNITDDDKLLVQTTTGTALIPFKSFNIPLDNLLCKSTISEMSDYFNLNSSKLDIIGDDLLNVENLTEDTITASINRLNLNDVANREKISECLNQIVTIINANSNNLVIPDGITLPIDFI